MMEEFAPFPMTQNQFNDMVFKGRRCSMCGSDKVVAVSTPDLEDGPFAASEIGKNCLCKECLLRQLGETNDH